MPPFIDQLFEDAGVGMLRDELGAQKLEALFGHLGDDGGIVQKPPAAERHQVAEFSGCNAKLVLVFSREKTGQKAYVRIFKTYPLDRTHVSTANTVACGT